MKKIRSGLNFLISTIKSEVLEENAWNLFSVQSENHVRTYGGKQGLGPVWVVAWHRRLVYGNRLTAQQSAKWDLGLNQSLNEDIKETRYVGMA